MKFLKLYENLKKSSQFILNIDNGELKEINSRLFDKMVSTFQW